MNDLQEKSMKINRDPQTNKISGPQRPLKTQPKTAASRTRKLENDKVELSSRAEEVRKFVELAKLVPEVRLDKVNTVKKQIQAGKYSVPPESVARSIIDFHKTLEPDDE